jgi:hypothetical protein
MHSIVNAYSEWSQESPDTLINARAQCILAVDDSQAVRGDLAGWTAMLPE